MHNCNLCSLHSPKKVIRKVSIIKTSVCYTTCPTKYLGPTCRVADRGFQQNEDVFFACYQSFIHQAWMLQHGIMILLCGEKKKEKKSITDLFFSHHKCVLFTARQVETCIHSTSLKALLMHPASLQCDRFREEAEVAVLSTPEKHTVTWRHTASIHVGFRQQRKGAIRFPFNV